MTEEILIDAEDRMQKAVDAFSHALAAVRTGRASTALVEHIQVEAYGQKMPLVQLATLAAPEAQMITVQPWDKGSVNPIIKAIQQSDLGITPQSDGSIIRLPIPPLTEQRRRDLVKQVHARTEEARVSVRNARRHAMDELKKRLRASEVSEDEEHRAEAEVERLTHEYIERVESVAKAKEQELMAV